MVSARLKSAVSMRRSVRRPPRREKPVRATQRIFVAVEPVAGADIIANAEARVARVWPSSFRIVPTADAAVAESVARSGVESLTWNVSSASASRSPITKTPIVRFVCPAAKTTVPPPAT